MPDITPAYTAGTIPADADFHRVPCVKSHDITPGSTDIEAANPCNVCKPELRSTCESLGRCDTRDAWRRVERSLAERGTPEQVQEALRALTDAYVLQMVDANAISLKSAESRASRYESIITTALQQQSERIAGHRREIIDYLDNIGTLKERIAELEGQSCPHGYTMGTPECEGLKCSHDWMARCTHARNHLHSSTTSEVKHE